MRIGVLGGTFDPPHQGHLDVAEAAIRALDLDEVMLLPASRNPLKRFGPSASAAHRLKMVKLLASGHEKLSVCDLEVQKGGTSYAVDTLNALTATRPAEYWFLIGSDVLPEILQWKSPHKLLRMCRLGVIARGSKPVLDLLARLPEEVRTHVDLVPMVPVDLSSTELRSRLAARKPVIDGIPNSVLHYIAENGLYRR